MRSDIDGHLDPLAARRHQPTWLTRRPRRIAQAPARNGRTRFARSVKSWPDGTAAACRASCATGPADIEAAGPCPAACRILQGQNLISTSARRTTSASLVPNSDLDPRRGGGKSGRLISARPPQEVGAVKEDQTSGSTGMPLRYRTTDAHRDRKRRAHRAHVPMVARRREKVLCTDRNLHRESLRHRAASSRRAGTRPVRTAASSTVSLTSSTSTRNWNGCWPASPPISRRFPESSGSLPRLQSAAVFHSSSS